MFSAKQPTVIQLENPRMPDMKRSGFSLLPQATDCAPDSDCTSSAANIHNRIISILLTIYGLGCQGASQQRITSWYKHHQPWPSRSPCIPKFQPPSSSRRTGKKHNSGGITEICHSSHLYLINHSNMTIINKQNCQRNIFKTSCFHAAIISIQSIVHNRLAVATKRQNAVNIDQKQQTWM